MDNSQKIRKKSKEHPYCYGKLDNVFPMGKDGLRETPESCQFCLDKTECLRAAMQSADGTKVKQEALNRAYRSGVVGFWERWSRKKKLHRKLKSEKR